MAADWTTHNPPTPRSTVGFFYPPPPSPTLIRFPADDTYAPTPSYIPKPTPIPPVPSLPAAYILPNNFNSYPINSSEKLHNGAVSAAPLTSLNPTPLSSAAVPSAWTSWKRIVLFVGLVLLSPLLSSIYTVLGAAILSLPVSLVASGAIGGVILSVPIAIGVFFLVSPWAPPPPPADFFDDTSSIVGQRYLKVEYLVCALAAVFVGACSAPIGAACISQSAGDAAKAGVLGGIIFFVVLVFWGLVGLFVWWMLVQRKLRITQRSSSEPQMFY